MSRDIASGPSWRLHNTCQDCSQLSIRLRRAWQCSTCAGSHSWSRRQDGRGTSSQVHVGCTEWQSGPASANQGAQGVMQQMQPYQATQLSLPPPPPPPPPPSQPCMQPHSPSPLLLKLTIASIRASAAPGLRTRKSSCHAKQEACLQRLGRSILALRIDLPTAEESVLVSTTPAT